MCRLQQLHERRLFASITPRQRRKNCPCEEIKHHLYLSCTLSPCLSLSVPPSLSLCSILLQLQLYPFQTSPSWWRRSVYFSLTFRTKASQNNNDKRSGPLSATALVIFCPLCACGGITSQVTCLNSTKRYHLGHYLGNNGRWPKRSSAVWCRNINVIRYERNPGINHRDASSAALYS